TPQRMLMFRSRGWNLRDNFGDVLKGMPIYEEVIDIDTEPRNLTDVIATASQPETKGVQVAEQLAKVATERGVEVFTPQTPTVPATEPSQPVEVKQSTPASPEPTPPINPPQAPPDQQPILDAIKAAEDILKADESGQKKY